jgi:hypothetical protein
MAMISQLICCFTGLMLMASAWAKFRAQAAFQEIVLDYSLPKWLMGRYVARMVPVVETVLGLALLSPFQSLSTIALGGTLLFVGIATMAVAQRVMRGEQRFCCGCGGDLGELQNAKVILIRNGLLLAIMAVGLITQIKTPVWPVAATPVYLAGGGLLLSLKLVGAMLHALRSLNAWKVDG